MIKNFLQKLLFSGVIFGVAAFVVLISSTIYPRSSGGGIESLKTQDSSVLGINTDNQEKTKCPKETPIIGWIDYAGNKKIVDDINQSPSACFRSIEEAFEQGWR